MYFHSVPFFWRNPIILGYNRNMSKRQSLMVLGIWILILPFLGFPGIIERILMLASGALVVIIAYTLAPRVRTVSSSNAPYAEHKMTPVSPRSAPVEKSSMPEVAQPA